MRKIKRALNYDLDDLLLQKYYPNPKSYKNAWRDVKGFLLKNGFESRQYSGVVSIKPLSIYQVNNVVDKLNNEFNWLAPCILKFDVTNIGRTHSLKDRFNNNQKSSDIKNTKTKEELEDTQNGIDELNKSLKELGIGNVELNTKSNDYTKGNEI